MTIGQEDYSAYRSSPVQIIKEYLDAVKLADVRQSELTSRKAKILDLDYRDLLIAQSSTERWEKMMNDPDIYFRRALCKKAYRLTDTDIMRALSLSSGAANNLFHLSDMPKWPRPLQLGVLFNHPWQLVNKKDPDEYSYSEATEYYYSGVAKRIHIKNLGYERPSVMSIAGYVITDPQELFPQECSPVTGRWVTTFPEMDYFEIHLNHEPLMDKVTQKRILNVFPIANDVITTYLPFRPKKRSLWIITPKKGRMNEYFGILNELTEYRDKTVHHSLK